MRHPQAILKPTPSCHQQWMSCPGAHKLDKPSCQGGDEPSGGQQNEPRRQGGDGSPGGQQEEPSCQGADDHQDEPSRRGHQDEPRSQAVRGRLGANRMSQAARGPMSRPGATIWGASGRAKLSGGSQGATVWGHQDEPNCPGANRTSQAARGPMSRPGAAVWGPKGRAKLSGGRRESNGGQGPMTLLRQPGHRNPNSCKCQHCPMPKCAIYFRC